MSRPTRTVVSGMVRAVVALALAIGALAGTSSPSQAVTLVVNNLTELQSELSSCTGTKTLALGAAITDPSAELTVACDLTIDLAGHDLKVRNVVVNLGMSLEVTDTTTPAGTLTADASGATDIAGIQNTGATLITSGTAHVVALGGSGGAGIGGGGSTFGNGGAGGTTTTNGSSTITATGGTGADTGAGGSGGAGIGGGASIFDPGGAGGTTTTNGSSTITATGGDGFGASAASGGAGIGGGGTVFDPGGAGGTTTTNGSSTITAIGGGSTRGGAGIGGGGSVLASGGAGGTTTTNNSTAVSATGGGGPGIGGGAGGASGGAGGGPGVTSILGASTITATAGSGGGSAVGAGKGGPAGPGAFLDVATGATLRLGSDLIVTDADADPASYEVKIEADGLIERRTSPPSTAAITGTGTIANSGAITLPTAAVAPTLVTDRHHGVSFNTQGGSAAPAAVTVYADTFAHGDRTLPADPTKPGYQFFSWNTAADGLGTTVTPTTVLPGTSADGAAAPLTLYAIYGQPSANLDDLQHALGTCTGTPAAPYQLALTADLTGTATELTVSCDAVIDLAGHDLTVRNIIVTTAKDLEVTDSTPVAPGADPNADAGTLTADASAITDKAGIQTTGATLTTSGTARLAATGGGYGAGIGGGYGGDGGTVITNGYSTVTAVGGLLSAGIGGGYNGGSPSAGNGGDTTANGHSAITATGGVSGAGIGGGPFGTGGTTVANGASTITAGGGPNGAGIGGGGGGAAGVTTANDTSTITATGGMGGAGIGRGSSNPTAGGSTTSTGSATIVAVGGQQAAGIGGGANGRGMTTTSKDTSTITATGGGGAVGAAGIGGGGGPGGSSGTTTIEGGSTITATGAGGASAVGIGEGATGEAGFLTVTDGTLKLGSDLVVPDAAGDPEVSIGAGGLIARRTSPASTAVITGDGIIDNDGAITLPTDAVDPTLVRNRHYGVSFDTQGGSAAPTAVTVYADTFARGDRTFPPDPTRNGYVFAGWNTTGDGSGDAITATTALPGSSNDGNAHPVTLYAQWLDPTSNLTGLKAALASCTGTPASPYQVALTADLTATATELVVNCDARIDLAGHDLTVRNVIVAAGTSLEVTDTTPVAPGPDPNADAGTLTADASAAADTAGIRTTGATLTTSGTAEVVTRGGYGSAGIGGAASAGGTTNSTDSSAITATGGAEGAGIGGGSFGDGGTTVAAEDSTITATGGSGAAGIGGGFGGDGASTTGTGHSTITATGGQYAAGIGGGATFAGGGAGAGTTDIGGGTSVTATSGGGASAIGIGDGGTPLPGTFLTVDGTLRLGSDLWIPDRAGSPEVSIGAGGLIARRTSPASAAAIIGAGTIANGGAITLPTAAVAPTLVTDRHYLVSFDTQGGSAAPSPVTVYADTFAHGERVFPPDPTQPGYAFDGWYTTPDGTGEHITATTPLPGTSLDATAVPVTLYAHWRYLVPDIAGLEPTITGTAQVGQTLHADPGPIWPPSADLAYQWNADGTPIPGATQPERGLNPDFEGALITVTITATAPGYHPATATSDPVGPVAPDDDPPLVCITQPKVTGDLWYDAVLTTTSGSWTGDPPDFSYQWLRDGDPIDGATAYHYRTTLADIGHDLSVVVTATRPPSTPGTAIAEAGTITTAPLTWTSPKTLKIKGKSQPGEKLRANLSQTALLTGTDPDATQVTYQWLRDGTTIKKATKPTYQVKNKDRGHRISLTVTLTKPGHTPLTLRTKPVRVKK